MKFLILLLSASWVCSFPQQNILQPNEVAQRRQIMSYSTNVIHQNPKNPDQTAESTVKVNFNPNQVDQNQGSYQFNSYPRENRYTQALVPTNHNFQNNGLSVSQTSIPVNNNYNNNNGLSVSQSSIPSNHDFTSNGLSPSQSPIPSNHNFNSNGLSASDQSQLFNVGYSVSFTNGKNAPKTRATPAPKFTRSSLGDGDIITGTRKFNEEVEAPNFDVQPQDYVSNALLEKQHRISGIKSKPFQQIRSASTVHPKTLLSQAHISPQTQKYYMALEKVKVPSQNQQEIAQKYSWQKLSPSVEIIRSTEIPAVNRFPKSDQARAFDHAKALGRSQGFDYSNALDVNAQQSQAQSQYQNLFAYNPQESSPVLTRQMPLAVNQRIPLVLPTPNFQPPIYPVDTSLLRERPVLITDYKNLPNDPSIVPIHMDTRLLQEAMKNELASAYSTNTQFQYAPQQSVPESSQESFQPQVYHTITSEQVENKPQESAKGFQRSPNPYQYKVYGKLQQPIKRSRGFRQEGGEQVKRQPRYVIDLQRGLRPPPRSHKIFQRRILLD